MQMGSRNCTLVLTVTLRCRGEDKFDMSALNARIQKVKAREANPVLNMQDKVTDAMEPVKMEAVKMKNRLPDPKAAIPVTGLPKWVVSAEREQYLTAISHSLRACGHSAKCPLTWRPPRRKAPV